MASLLEQSQLSSVSTAPTPNRGKLEEPDHSSSNWYFTREEIEKQSPSRLDGIDMKKETYFRKSYCTFLQDLGMRLKVPQVTIATAIVFCHRFFHRQSHAKNDRHTIATACMFLAGKVEETPQSLKNVILVSYEIRNKKDPAAIQRIKQKEVYEQQKELVCVAEKFVLAILGFDLNVHHPYKPLVAAIKKFKVAQNALAQVAWNFVNDGLRTSLCLQFKPHHIAAGAIFLAAKFLKVKLPSDGEVVWWQEFDVTPLQLEDVSNQMLELYEQNRPAPLGRGSDIGGSSGVNNHHNIGSHAPSNGASQRAGYSSPGTANTAIGIEAAHAQNVSDEVNDSMKYASNASQHRQNEDSSHTDNIQSDNAEESAGRRKYAEASDRPTDISDESQQEDPVPNLRGREKLDGGNGSPKLNRTGDEIRVKREADNDDGKKTWVGIGDVNKDKVKAALEKRRKSRGEVGKPSKPKTELIDEDDLIERELESGVEAAFSQSEKAKQDRRESWGRTSHRPDQGEMDVKRDQQDEDENGRKRRKTILDAPPEKRPRSDDDLEGKAERNRVIDNPHDITEEGELPEFSAYDQSHSPRSGDKRSISPLSSQYEKGGSPGRRREHGARDQPVSRDLSHDKHRHSNHHYNHSSHYNQQHRPEVDRDRHHYKEREKQERDYKKSRHDHGK